VEKRHPGRYVQARGAIEEIVPLLESGSTLVVGGRRAWDVTRRCLAAAGRLPDSCPDAELVEESGARELSRLTDACRRRNLRAVLAIGGGRAIDAGKACATVNDLPCHVAPTVLGSDAACSSVSVIYDEQGAFQRYLDGGRNPRQVIVDLEVLRDSPGRYFAAGVAGALAVFFEAEESIAAGRFTGSATLTARYLDSAQRGRDSFLALDPARLGSPATLSPADLDSIVFQALWVSADLFENVGLSLAHGVYRALRGLGLAGRDGWLHGELVGLGLLCQLQLSDTHQAQRERTFRFVREMLRETDWAGLARSIADRDGPFERAIRAFPVARNLRTPVEAERICATVREILDRLC
jgi:glycerol dehydrogenase